MSSVPTILLIDDERTVFDDLNKLFRRKYALFYAPSSEAAIHRLDDNYQFDAILLDLELDPSQKTEKEGLILLPILRERLPNIPIIIITKFNSTANVVEAMKLGANDFFYKEERDAIRWSKEIDQHIKASRELGSSATQSKPTQKASSVSATVTPTFVGISSAIQKIKNVLTKLSSKPNVTVLLTGETGVGKEVAARYLHESGVRRNQPFRAVHLSAITATTMESDLFGHIKGSFTDAQEDKKGIFEEADGGILFLDEIGEINHDIQVKLLRFLEYKVIRPVGGDDEKTLDVQIVAATNRNLSEEVNKGNFRKDLYYRLNQFQIVIPPLRERVEDIDELLGHFLRHGGDKPNIISTTVRQFLLSYSWPGNVREMANWIKSATIKREILEQDEIDESLLSEDMLKEKQGGSNIKTAEQVSTDSPNEEATPPVEAPSATPLTREKELYANVAKAELEVLERALVAHNGRKGDAAKSLNKSADNIRYLVEKHFEKMPQLFTQFPMISKCYKLR